jgi:hypothetical protein
LNYLLDFLTQPRRLVEALQKLPLTIDDSYDEVLHKIGIDDPHKFINKDLALRTLAWIFYTAKKPGARPLRMQELRDLLVTEPDDSIFRPQYRSNPHDIIAVCQSLIIHDEETDTVRFTHYSVYEFLRNCKQLPSVSILSKICLTYLSFEIFDKGMSPNLDMQMERLENYKAAPFVAAYWGFFIKNVDEDEDIQAAAITLLSSEPRLGAIVEMEIIEANKRYNQSINWKELELYVEGQKIIHVLARQGMEKTLTNFIDGKFDGNVS